ncbi:hypothetical protein CDL12_25591 [Handroanthus impetiginosus]|uniref:Uncharacterized protein n=1 Tax=Handroanthus impetiginosus TaxID=429701 RepID=A0A2G9G9D5_9LAMI|nr:hypothetical protein CDL12_25591 [Handroanthus impetiginosus]
MQKESNFTDFLNDPDEDISIENCPQEYNPTDVIQVSNEAEAENRIEEENNSSLEPVDFQFVDNIGSLLDYSPFEITEEISKPIVQEDEPLMLSEAMKRMNYERKFSASLYAFNGITECLRMKLGKNAAADQISRLRNACKMKQEEKMMMNKNSEEEKVKKNEDENSLLDEDGELLLWNSIDLPNICYVS